MARRRLTPPVSTALTAVAVVVAGVLLLVTRATIDAFQLPKAAALWLGVPLVALAALWGTWNQPLRLPGRVPTALFALVPGFLAISLFVTDNVPASIVGFRSRHAGVLTYAALALLAWLIVWLTQDQPDRLVRLEDGLAVGLGAATLYGLVQLLGMDPLAWSGSGNDVIATVGNPNFAAAVTGIAAGTFLSRALRHAGAPRVAWALACLAAVVVALGTGALQAPVVMLLAVAPVARAWMAEHHADLATKALRPALAVAALAATVGVAGLAGVGPLSSVGDQTTVVLRRQYWRGAAEVIADAPLLGVGADRFVESYRPVRTSAAANLSRDLAVATDPHNVPLAMTANAGIGAGLAYLAVIGLGGVAAFAALKRRVGPQRYVAATFAGAWLGYQAQSMISMDMPSLSVIHWSSLGALVALSGMAAPKERAARRATVSRSVIGAASGLLLVVAVTLGGREVIGAARAQHALSASQSGDAVESAMRYEQAAALATWRPDYTLASGESRVAAGDLDGALVQFQAAAAAEHSLLRALLRGIEAAATLGDYDLARTLAASSLERDPNYALVWSGAATVEILAGTPADGLPFAQRAVELADDAPSWTVLGQVHEASGDIEAAREAYATALTRDAGYGPARDAVDRLG